MTPDADEAREELRRELARSEYQESPLERLVGWVEERWDELTDQAASVDGLPTLAAAFLTVVLLALLAVTLPRIRRDAGRGAEPRGVLDGPTRSSDDLRREAEEAARAGDHAGAVATAVRALVRRAAERGLIDDSPGRTTHEVLDLVAARFPDHAARLHHHAGLFDAVVYGRRPATAAQAEGALRLEGDVRRARPSREAAALTGAPTVPR